MTRVLLAVVVVIGCGGSKKAAPPPAQPVESSQEEAKESRPESTEAVANTEGTGGDCDAEALKEKAMMKINDGEHAASVALFEASLACKDDEYVRQLAFMESCASQNSAKAKLYYAKLSTSAKDKFKAICDRQKPPVPYK